MDEAGVRDVLLARAVEETDAQGALVGERRRVAATREAQAEAGGDREAFLLARARLLIAPLVTGSRAFARVRELAGRAVLPGWLAFAGALLLGLAVDRIGPARRLDLLAPPLLGLFAWNLAVYVGLLAARLRRRGAAATVPPGGGLGGRALRWLASPARPWARAGGERRGAAASALERFLGDWARVGARLHGARLARALHLGAAGLALGVVLGMYVRGLVFEYRASWESTFLGPDAVRAIVATVLAPASALLAIPLPTAEELAALRVEGGQGPGGSAAPWIHLYAVTALYLVVLPRLALAGLAGRRARRLGRALPVDWDADPYFMRVSAVERGAGARAAVEPYSYRPSARALDGLQALLLDLLGNRLRVEARAPYAYGDDPLPAQALFGDPAGREVRALLFNLGQSPEQEVHGAFVERLLHDAELRGGEPGVLVVVDESAFRARLGPGPEADERLEERRRSWARALREAGLEGAFLELDASLSREALGRVRAALWSPGTSEVVA